MAYQTVTDATFDEDSTTGGVNGHIITPKYRGSTLQIVTADTDQQTVKVQREQGSVGSGSWVTVKTYVNENFTYSTVNKDNSRYRIIATADAGGASTATWTESVVQADAVYGQDGKPIFTVDSFEKDILNGTVAAKGVYTSARKHCQVETASFTASEKHANRLTGLDASGGALTVTLPSSTGSLDVYEFVLVADPGSNDVVISCDADDGAFVGVAKVATDASAPAAVGAAAGNDLITLNNTTTGGLHGGDRIRLTDIKTDFWFAEVVTVSSGAEASVFSGS